MAGLRCGSSSSLPLPECWGPAKACGSQEPACSNSAKTWAAEQQTQSACPHSHRRIQIEKFGRHAGGFDLRQLAKSTDGFTGSEIEQVFVEALYRGFDLGEEPIDLTIGLALTDFVPLSKLMVEQLSGLRSWSKGRARPATTPAPEQKGRRIAS